MSRNLCVHVCYICGTEVTFDEDPRPITEKNAGIYFEEFEGMLVANATCTLCLAEYLVWVDGSERIGTYFNGEYEVVSSYPQWFDEDARHPEGVFPKKGTQCPVGDMSYRSTFDDETYTSSDLPKFPDWLIEWKLARA